MPRPRQLLVIDDQRLDRAIAAHAAARAGFSATTVSGITDARRLLEGGGRFEFVILDLLLGGEDGLEALRLLARFDKTASVVFVSGLDGRVLSASQRLASILGLRVAGIVRKPFVPAALIALLRSAPGGPNQDHEVSPDIEPGVIRSALAQGHIEPWFQPKISLATGEIVGAETLARWVGADGLSISPTTFVPVAERSGLIAALTDTILEQALRECARWRRRRPNCSVAVNISPLLLSDPSLTERIENRLQSSGVPPGSLVLEITETDGIPDTPCATEILTRLRIRGVNLAIDDFGTGHSSLLSLVHMPFNEMKIDQAFVREATSNKDARKVVRASASLGRELGLNVVAEGVETEMMARLVEAAGCHVGQGWLYGDALPPELFEEQLLGAEVAPDGRVLDHAG